jgi:hypothetical protein
MLAREQQETKRQALVLVQHQDFTVMVMQVPQGLEVQEPVVVGEVLAGLVAQE